MVIIKSKEEIAIMKEGGKILAAVLKMVADAAKPGIATLQLNSIAEREILKRGATPSFKDYSPEDESGSPYPAALCVAINDAVVHGIPDETKIKEGDIVGLDLGAEYKGCYTDAAMTVAVGKCSKEAERLIKTAKLCLKKAAAEAKAGARVGNVSAAIQQTAEKAGFSVVRDLAGHGVGRFIHEDPFIFNYGKRGEGIILEEGMTLAIEPMLNSGKSAVKLLDDGWTYKTADGTLSAHFEYTILVKRGKPEVITPIF